MNLSDTEIENLLLGKWRFDTDWEKIYVEFKDDMSYEQTKIQTFLLSKPIELITGNKFTGVWHVKDSKLCLTIKSIPKSIVNLELPKLSKNYLVDMIVRHGSWLITENYEIVQINNYDFILMYKNESLIGSKIK
ncbi:hypothetical protein JYQ62_16805 [Nostoc sp. UHCC 0702]|nr:hypothetical protein JYQ62_16805 [Nostoc sp. UHCC 0702]